MRIYNTNEKGEKLYQMECLNFHCRYSIDSVITVIWSKDDPIVYCKKCGRVLFETKTNWVPLPEI